MNQSAPQSTQDSGPDRWPSALWALVKIGLAASVIVIIAFGVAIVGERGSVPESHADIFDLGFAPGPDQQQFSDSLASLGHNDPQVFELNGNTVYFSVDYQRDDPQRIADRYQREFVNRNINDRIYNTMSASEGEELLTARMTGQIAPVKMSENRVVMGGMVTTNQATDRAELLEQIQSANSENDLFRAHRWIEIFRQPGEERSTVLATWSNDDFSYEKMLPDDNNRTQSVTNRGIDPDVPACPGCVRVNNFSDLEDPRGYRSNIFVTDARADEMIRFYRQAMTRRGWTISEMQQGHEQVGEAVNFDGDHVERLHLEVDNQRLEVFAYRLDADTVAVQTALWQRINDELPLQ